MWKWGAIIFPLLPFYSQPDNQSEGSRPESSVLILSNPANICAGHTNTPLTHRQYRVSVRQNFRLGKRLWWIILRKAASGPGSISATIILEQTNDHRRIDLSCRLFFFFFPFLSILVCLLSLSRNSATISWLSYTAPL